ncbi:MAG: lysophospholipase, partial [Bacillota bacterium]|nr:lysophospholipase [Bacillota bacterium]
SSNDGLHWLPIKEWTFDDGQALGSYNTQAHWLSHSKGLFLTYTRRGANNDHIARNRAPLFIAEVDPVKLQVLRSTEKVLIPERGVMLGNFGAAPINKNESWVTDAEFIVGDKPNPKGADGSVWVARVIWNKNNKLKCCQ